MVLFCPPFVPFSEGPVKSTDEVHVLGKVITGDVPTSIKGDIGTQGVIEYIRRVSDIKREWSTPGE